MRPDDKPKVPALDDMLGGKPEKLRAVADFLDEARKELFDGEEWWAGDLDEAMAEAARRARLAAKHGKASDAP